MKERIKAHIIKYKVVYSCAITGVVVAGITGVIMRKGCGAAIRGVTDGPVRVTVQPFSFFSKQKNEITTMIHRGGTGSPSYVVECLDTGEAWLSQRQASMAKHISEAVLSGHLNGKFTDADGFHFRRIGVATA